MNKRIEPTGHHGHADDYAIYETEHTSKGDAKMKQQLKPLDEVLQATNPGTANDKTIFFTDGTYATGTIHELADAVDEHDHKDIRAAISHGDEQLLGALDGWYGQVEDPEFSEDISAWLTTIDSWEAFKTQLPDEYEQDLQDLWIAAKNDEELIISKVYGILQMRKGGIYS